MLNEGMPGTSSIYLSPFKINLFGKRNVLAALDDEYFNFVDAAPMIPIDPNFVKNIRENEFEAVKEKLKHTIEELKNSMAKKDEEYINEVEWLKSNIQMFEEGQQTLRLEHQEAIKGFSIQLETVRTEHQGNMKQMQEDFQRQIEAEKEANRRFRESNNNESMWGIVKDIIGVVVPIVPKLIEVIKS